GKTTTLYSILRRFDKEAMNIITIEDPVEYRLEGINQIQVNPHIGLGFATVLRTVLRQDPDVIMVGEIRDPETADIAIQAALTGHRVLSTVHTNDAPSAVVRLTDMGVQPFLIAASVTGVISQRLVRVICSECRESYKPSEDELLQLGVEPGEVGEIKLYRGRGCKFCFHTGYKGRTGIFEVMVVNDEIRKLIVEKASTDDIRKAAIESGMITLRQDAAIKVLRGITTLEEINRVIYTEV
ncbi:TPA: type II/IV secretion system protein, partial [Candidatus Poribacteria bacterium]|nr:type II/IV secretion system protein [Candidatus Poribacteria bacterium]HEX30318.1 type II/IV secretion system protein [Candidatus Poribacteria bacterium]